MQSQVKMLELSERKILNIKKYVHISPNIHVQQNRIMNYNWLIMFSQNTNKLQSNVWFCSVLVVILFFPTAKPQNNLHNLVRVFVVRLTYSTRSLEES